MDSDVIEQHILDIAYQESLIARGLSAPPNNTDAFFGVSTQHGSKAPTTQNGVADDMLLKARTQRTIEFIKKRRIDIRQWKEHECSPHVCWPVNITQFICDRAIQATFDKDVYVCRYGVVHICNEKCMATTIVDEYCIENKKHVCDENCLVPDKNNPSLKVCKLPKNIHRCSHRCLRTKQGASVCMITGNEKTEFSQFATEDNKVVCYDEVPSIKKLHMIYEEQIKQDAQWNDSSYVIRSGNKSKHSKQRRRKRFKESAKLLTTLRARLNDKISKAAATRKKRTKQSVVVEDDNGHDKSDVQSNSDSEDEEKTKRSGPGRKKLIKRFNFYEWLLMLAGAVPFGHGYLFSPSCIHLMKNISLEMFLISTGQMRVSNFIASLPDHWKSKLNPTHIELIMVAEHIMATVSPGVRTLEQQQNFIITEQNFRHSKAFFYLKQCKESKTLPNIMEFMEHLRFPQHRYPDMTYEWPTWSDWIRWLVVILHWWLVCERTSTVLQKFNKSATRNYSANEINESSESVEPPAKRRKTQHNNSTKTAATNNKMLNDSSIMLDNTKGMDYIQHVIAVLYTMSNTIEKDDFVMSFCDVLKVNSSPQQPTVDQNSSDDKQNGGNSELVTNIASGIHHSKLHDVHVLIPTDAKIEQPNFLVYINQLRNYDLPVCYNMGLKTLRAYMEKATKLFPMHLLSPLNSLFLPDLSYSTKKET